MHSFCEKFCVQAPNQDVFDRHHSQRDRRHHQPVVFVCLQLGVAPPKLELDLYFILKPYWCVSSQCLSILLSTVYHLNLEITACSWDVCFMSSWIPHWFWWLPWDASAFSNVVGNQLVGTIPSEIGLLTGLTRLYVAPRVHMNMTMFHSCNVRYTKHVKYA